MEESLISYLLAPGSQVASACASRIYWVLRPQGTTAPALVLNVISTVPDYVMSAPAGGQRLTESRVQCDAYAPTYASAKEIIRALNARLSGATFTQGAIEFQGAFVDGERDSYEAMPNSSDRLFRTSVDFLIWHT